MYPRYIERGVPDANYANKQKTCWSDIAPVVRQLLPKCIALSVNRTLRYSLSTMRNVCWREPTVTQAGRSSRRLSME